MPDIDIQRTLNVPAVPAQAAASAILHEIADGRAEWSDFALYLQLGSLGFPDVGYIAIPVSVAFLKETTEPHHRIDFTVHARRSPQAFPVLQGALGIDAAGTSSSRLWLGGSYELPGGAAGAVYNKLAGERVASLTLENLAAELANAIESRVQRTEIAQARYRMVFHAGD